MITTRFLSNKEYGWYADWLKDQDDETLRLYFGIPVTDYFIENLVKGFVDNPEKHQFLVAERNGVWVGTIHIAIVGKSNIEFGVIVASSCRQQGVADQMMEEAIVWARNCGFKNLYMHCLTWNRPIRNLCEKHNLEIKNFTDGGETESLCKLPPRTLSSIGHEYVIKNRNLYRMILQTQEEMFVGLYK